MVQLFCLNSCQIISDIILAFDFDLWALLSMLNIKKCLLIGLAFLHFSNDWVIIALLKCYIVFFEGVNSYSEFCRLGTNNKSMWCNYLTYHVSFCIFPTTLANFVVKKWWFGVNPFQKHPIISFSFGENNYVYLRFYVVTSNNV